MNREIEMKFISDATYEELVEAFEYYPTDSPTFDGESEDYYWPLRNFNADFLRLRTDGTGCELTIKKKDKGGNFNRMERNVEILSPIETVLPMFEALYGTDHVSIRKVYRIIDEGTAIISFYKLEGRAGTFIEVESHQEYRVLLNSAKVLKHLSDRGIVARHESRSVYEMFVKEKEKGDGKVLGYLTSDVGILGRFV
jgi:hypothetical protein